MQRALTFVSRCQTSKASTTRPPSRRRTPTAASITRPPPAATAKAGQTENGGLRSYASMTYAGLKSMIYAGVGPDDPRVKAAVKWARHYGLDDNPGIGSAGLYYYYHTFAKALDAAGLKTIKDKKGVEHDWRQDLLAELVRRQRPNGSWVNEKNARWLEGEPCLVTGYALLSLAYCRPGEEEEMVTVDSPLARIIHAAESLPASAWIGLAMGVVAVAAAVVLWRRLAEK